MQEFRDGSFGEVMPANLLIEQMAKAMAGASGLPDLKAVHFGTQEELENIRAKEQPRPVLVDPVDVTSLKARMDDLEKQVAEATMQHHTQGVRVYPATTLNMLSQAEGT